jgi:hypothetical protein
VMLHVVKLNRSGGPETIAVMTAAFDTVCQSLSSRILACQRCARLTDAAFRELAGIDRSAVR